MRSRFPAKGSAPTMRCRPLRRLSFVWLLWALVLVGLCSLGAVSGGMAQATEVRNPTGVALIIGNSDYPHRDVPDVTFAHRDADAFRRYVIDVLGYDPENIIDLRDTTRRVLFDALGTQIDPHGLLWSYLDDEVGSDVVFFYSGHGVPGVNDGLGYLLPVDADPKAAEQDGYPIDALYESLNALTDARSVRVYLDACFSGGSAGGVLIKDASPVYVTPALPEGVGGKVVSLSAASGKQVASWDAEAKHGLFTHHLLDALHGGGDADSDGRVTALEVKTYLDRRMTKAARRQHRRIQRASLLGTENVVLSAALADGSFPARSDLDDAVWVPVGTENDDGGGETAPALDLGAVTGGHAILTVETTPAGATVLLSGARVGETPLRRYDLRAGTYTVMLDHPSHETVHLEDQVLENRRVLSIQRTLASATGSVTVVTTPDGGWVEHEGERLSGTTPVTLDGLPSGHLVLTLGAKGHRPERVEVDVPKGGVALLERTLQQIKYGTLTLELEPVDAQVTLADSDASYRAGMKLAEGQHEVRVTREGYHEVSRVVTVLGETRERIALERAPQPFTVVTTPVDANVRFLDGADAYRPGMALLPGTYRVRVSAEGWETQEAAVRHGTAPTRHAVTLKRTWDPEADEAALELKRSEEELVQLGLATTGFDPGTIDGWIGGDTRKALRAWQAARGHEVTGYLTVDQAKQLIAAGREAERNRPGDEFQDCDYCPEMVVVPAGSFRMGSPRSEMLRGDDEGPQHTVTIPEPFAVGKYEVTFAEWDACVAAGGCGGLRPDDRGWGRGRHPVINVSWQDAKAYVGWLSRKMAKDYRLLTEAEWEYVARAGTTGPFYFGSTISTLQSNYDGTGIYGPGRKGVSRKRTVPVGTFPANAFGLYDMHGNVYEWVEDCWHGNYVGAPANGNTWTSGGDCARRVWRGGSWISVPKYLRSAQRSSRPTANRYHSGGFRVALTLAP